MVLSCLGQVVTLLARVFVVQAVLRVALLQYGVIRLYNRKNEICPFCVGVIRTPKSHVVGVRASVRGAT